MSLADLNRGAVLRAVEEFDRCVEGMKTLARDWRWGAPLARAPDRRVTEALAAEAVIKHLGWRLECFELAPKPDRSPDVLAVIENGSRIGIEVIELGDQGHIEHMEAVKKGREAVARPPRAPASIQDEIRARLVEKGQKRHKALLGGDRSWCEPLDEYFVVLHTDERLIHSQPDIADAALAGLAPVALPQVTRAFFLIWYVPKSVGPRPRIYEIALDRAR
jgi:hypothetical protein